eukprot:scaffold1652_cov394-Prasinococcus_capsulatus_cf.AAC.6
MCRGEAPAVSLEPLKELNVFERRANLRQVQGKNQEVPPPEFLWVQHEEPHVSRRRKILAAHPEVKTLFGPDVSLFPKLVGIVAAQMLLARTVSFTLGFSCTSMEYEKACGSIGGVAGHSHGMGIGRLLQSEPVFGSARAGAQPLLQVKPVQQTHNPVHKRPSRHPGGGGFR